MTEAKKAKANLSEELDAANLLASKELEAQAVSQGAYVEGNKDSKQNDPAKAAEHRQNLEKEGQEAAKERQELKKKQLEEAKKEREAARKEAESA